MQSLGFRISGGLIKDNPDKTFLISHWLLKSSKGEISAINRLLVCQMAEDYEHSGASEFIKGKLYMNQWYFVISKSIVWALLYMNITDAEVICTWVTQIALIHTYILYRNNTQNYNLAYNACQS